tara:strand:- start:1522 stop:2355 length:834 start_codon:yes stop_codon:yes gene_type:complete
MNKKILMKKKLGFMQGRLIPSEKKGRIQYFPEKNWKKEIYLANKNNYKYMEWTMNIENIQKNPIFFEEKLKDLKNLLKKNEIKIYSITCDFFMQRPFFKLKKNMYILNILKRIIKNSQKIGIKYFIIPLVDESSIKNINQEKLLINKMKKFKKYLNKNSKILFEIDYSPSRTVKFIKSFESSKFGINLDTGDGAGYGYNYQEDKSYFKYVKNIHLKDKKFKKKTIRLGEGDFDFKSFFELIKKVNYKGIFILQPARPLKKSDENELNLNRKFINKFL